MKTIRILIAASDEMHDENLKFSELITNLNEVLEPRGIELERVKWNPETDGSIDEFKASLTDCEMCLTLYWKSLVANSDVELDTAYQELKDGHNPRKLYVFFKEPSEDIADALRDFKASFENKYGHFFCRFENVDTMNLHFILQFEAYSNQMNSDLVKVTDGKVLVGDREMVNLDNVPFAAMNKEYQRLKREKVEIELECSEARKKYLANPESEELEEEYDSLKSKRKNVAEESERYQKHLYNIALTIVKTGEDGCTDQMRLARELFEKGEAAAADEIFDLDKIMDEDNQDEQLVEQLQQKRVQRIRTLVQAAVYAMGNGERSLDDRFNKASMAYEDAICIAKKINYDKAELVEIIYDYAHLYEDFNRNQEASSLYQEAIKLTRELITISPYDGENYHFLATALLNLGNVQRDQGQYKDAEENYREALAIWNKRFFHSPTGYGHHKAIALGCLGNLQRDQSHYAEAEKNLREAIGILRELPFSNKYRSSLAQTLNNLGSLLRDTGRFAEAEENLQEALTLRYELASDDPETYRPGLASTLHSLGFLQHTLGRFSEAEWSYREA